MKVLFLDFDGVLNSWQEAYMHDRLQQSRWNNLKWKAANLVVKGLRRVGLKIYQHKRLLYYYHVLFTWHNDFCPIACSNLRLLLDEEPDLRIVVSSSWRIKGLWYVRKVLAHNGIPADRVIGVTGYEGVDADGKNTTRISGVDRGHQIQKWLYHAAEAHGLGLGDRVTHIAIVDDDSDMDHLTDFFVKTSMEEGFMWRHKERVRDVLKVPYKLGHRYDPENPIT